MAKCSECPLWVSFTTLPSKCYLISENIDGNKNVCGAMKPLFNKLDKAKQIIECLQKDKEEYNRICNCGGMAIDDTECLLKLIEEAGKTEE